MELLRENQKGTILKLLLILYNNRLCFTLAVRNAETLLKEQSLVIFHKQVNIHNITLQYIKVNYVNFFLFNVANK